MALTPYADDVYEALKDWLQSIVEADVEVRLGQANRVAPPVGQTFVIFTRMGHTRNETNIVAYDGIANTRQVEQKTIYAFQIDVYGANSGDIVSEIAIFARDDTSQIFPSFVAIDGAVTDMSDPIQMPWEDTEQQIEERWVATLSLQVNISITAQQSSANLLDPAGISLVSEA